MEYKPPQSAKELLERYANGERNFHHANLFAPDLVGANLSRANFFGAYLQDANFHRANLSGANLFSANLNGAIFGDANLSGANLTFANLVRADFSGADLSGACVGFSALGRVSLREFCKADPAIVHSGPSAIDFESITMSLLAPNLEKFLVRAGIPAIAAQYMIESAQAVKGSVWDMMQSVFISYGSPDEVFARKLYEALHSNGVRTFFFAEHAEPGKALHRTMREGVNEHDRVILICSKNSLTRNGVLNEIEESLRREGKQAGQMLLIPITLDNFIYGDKWQPPDPGMRSAILARIVADFRGLKKDPAKFDVEIRKLVNVLKKKHVTSQTQAVTGTAAKPANKRTAKKIGAPKKATVAKKVTVAKKAPPSTTKRPHKRST